MAETGPASAWERIHQREMQLSVTHPPANGWEQTILWTEQGKLWTLPVNNEAGEPCLSAPVCQCIRKYHERNCTLIPLWVMEYLIAMVTLSVFKRPFCEGVALNLPKNVPLLFCSSHLQVLQNIAWPNVCHGSDMVSLGKLKGKTRILNSSIKIMHK